VPSRSQHLAKAETNQRLSLALQSGPNLDWSATVLFYAALHLVEAVLAPHVHSVNHTARFGHVRNHPHLHPIFFHYRELYNVSLQSRYECEALSLAVVKRLYIANYEPIKQHLRPLLGFTF
jgi:hypothetical protein